MKLSRRKLIQAMARACMSDRDICEKADIPRTTFSQVKRGMRNPRTDTIGKIAAALGIDPSELFEWEGIS